MHLPTQSRKDRRRRDHRRLRSRRIRALLASGLVLGVGTMVTLAAWTDEEYATGTLEAGTFNISGSVNQGPFQNLSPDAHQLEFSPGSHEMYPGSTTYALFSVRTDTDSSMDGSVEVRADQDNSTGLGLHLSYGISIIPDGEECAASTFGGENPVILEPTLQNMGVAPGGPQPLAAQAGNQVNYCFQLTLSDETPNEFQGDSVNPTWEFHATSDAPVSN